MIRHLQLSLSVVFTPEDQPSCEHHRPHSECESTTSELTNITMYHLNPELIISETQLGHFDVSPPASYHETNNNTPGVCVDRNDRTFSWSPINEGWR